MTSSCIQDLKKNKVDEDFKYKLLLLQYHKSVPEYSNENECSTEFRYFSAILRCYTIVTDRWGRLFSVCYRKRSLLYFFLFLFCSLRIEAVENSNSIDKQEIIQCLKTLSSIERESITNFFKYVFFSSSFGYVLFGDKPMSFDVIRLDKPLEQKIKSNKRAIAPILDQTRLKEGWQVWEKYKNLFPSKKFSLISHSSHLGNSNWIFIAMINRESFLRILKENIADFHCALSSQLPAEEILHEFLKGEGPVFETIRNHDGLFGTVLGYGRGNAWTYYINSDRCIFEPFNEQDPKDTKAVMYPSFLVIPHTGETINLRKKYGDQKQKIDLIYQSDDFLIQVLLQWTK